MAEKIGKDNIISAVVHMDEKTPHMHLSFCPITADKRLSAKDILGNQKKLSNWQTEFHACMSDRWNVLERGLSSMETGRKHIPLWLFKTATRLDKQFDEVQAALSDINAFNAGKRRDKALNLLAKWLPQAEKFTAQIKKVDGYIKTLEQAEKETQKRIKAVESKGDERVRTVQNTMQKTIDGKDNQLAEKDKEILAAQREAFNAADQLRRQMHQVESLIGRLPLAMRERIYEERQKMADKTKSQKERGKAR